MKNEPPKPSTKSAARPPAPLQAFFLVGPTASGKSAVAQRLAEQMDASILSADAMLVYRDMDIGTDKPTHEQRRRVPYWGLDMVAPNESFSTGAYLRHAAQVQVPEDRALLVVGGTGLYVKALTEGLDEQPPAQPEVRAFYEKLLSEKGLGALQQQLEQLAPGALHELADPENPRRLIRRLEWAHSGSSPERPDKPAVTQPTLIGLKKAPHVLYKDIEHRTRRIFAEGLIEEVEQIRKRYGAFSPTARQAIGYQEAADVLDGKRTLDEAIERVLTRTRRLAKRQRTWFRHQAAVHWIETQPDIEETAAAVRAAWSHYGPARLAFQPAR